MQSIPPPIAFVTGKYTNAAEIGKIRTFLKNRFADKANIPFEVTLHGACFITLTAFIECCTAHAKMAVRK